MSAIPGMVLMSLEELRTRVAPPIREIGDNFFAEKWNSNHFGAKEKFTLKQLEAYRQFLGVSHLGKEEFFFLVSRDMAMPEDAHCTDCHNAIYVPIRWYVLNEDGWLEMDHQNFGFREFGQTAIILDAKDREFVAKFCVECMKKHELPQNSRWQSYAASLREIAKRVERRNAEQAARKKAEPRQLYAVQ